MMDPAVNACQGVRLFTAYIDTPIKTKQNESRNQCSGTWLSMHIRFLTKEGSSCHQSFSEVSVARSDELFRE